MKFVNLVQQTQEWFDAKARTIGASEIAAVLGVSSYSTPFDIWCRKTKRYFPASKPTVATERGNYFENLIRAKCELETWFKLLPLSAVHDDNDRISCSFDGIDTKAKIIVEIKVPKKEVVDAAKNGVLTEVMEKIAATWRLRDFCSGGVVHPEYYPQVQYQLMIAGPEYTAHFLVGEFEKVNGKEKIVAIHKVIVKPDPEFQAKLMIAALGMLYMIDKDIQPPLMPEDVMELKDKDSVALFTRLWNAKIMADKTKKKPEKEAFGITKQEVIEHIQTEAKHVNVKAGGVIVRQDKNGKWSVRKA